MKHNSCSLPAVNGGQTAAQQAVLNRFSDSWRLFFLPGMRSEGLGNLHSIYRKPEETFRTAIAFQQADSTAQELTD